MFNSLFPLPGTVAAAVAAWLLALALKSALLLGAVGLLCLALRRASAAARHLVWLLAVVGALSLPLLSLLAPPLHLPAATSPAAVSTAPPPLPALHHVPAPASAPSAPDAQAFPSAQWTLLLAALWGLVALGALLRLGLGLSLAGRLTRRCPPVTDPALLAEMRRLTEAAGVRRRVGLRQGVAVAVPMTTGLRCPIVLIPADAGDWPAGRLQAALGHELAHVGRRDWAWHGLAGVACALYWFNPLMWLAAHRLRAESEHACDDAVLAAGTLPADYAGHLLEIARRLSVPCPCRPSAAIAMAHRPQIEGRLRAILGVGLDRRGLTRRRLLLALVAAVLVLLPLAALRTAGQDRPQGKVRAEAVKMVSLSNLRQIGLAVVVYAQDHGGRLPDADQWVDEIAPTLGNEKTLRSLLWDQAAPPSQPYGYAFNRSLSGVNLATLKDPSQVVMVFESTLGRRNAADTGQSVPLPGRHEGGTHYVFADGRVRWVPDGEEVSFSAASAPVPPAGVNVRPLGTAVLTGRVVYEDGRPAANIRVGAQIQNGAQLKMSYASQGQVMLLPSGITLPLPSGAARPTPDQVRQFSGGEAVTGPDGTYRLTGLTEALYNVAVLPLDPKAIDNSDPFVATAVEGASAAEGKTVALRDLVLTPGGLVSGRVTDMAGKSLAGIFVGSYGPSRPASSAMIISARTDANGRYQLRVAPGSSRIYLGDERWKAQDATLTIAKGETKTADFQATPQTSPLR